MLVVVGGPGALRAPELRKALALLNVPLNEVHINHVIAAIDTDGNGEVDVKEFIAFVWKGRTDLLRRKLDTAAYTFGGRDYVKLFNHYDRDNNGSLDWDEFVNTQAQAMTACFAGVFVERLLVHAEACCSQGC